MATEKPTLFRILAGGLAQDAGEISYPLFEKNPGSGRKNWRNIKHQVAYVPQELPNWQGYLLQGLQFAAASHGIKGKENDEAVAFIVHRLGLQDYLYRKWKELSGGFKLRFALAHALIWKPKLLIIDEPLANLDFKTQLVVLNDLRSLTRSYRFPMGVVLSSQHLHEIEAVSDRILFLKQGKVQFYGSMEEVGVERKENTYEFKTSLSLAELKQKLTNLEYKRIHNNGLVYVLTTAIEMEASTVLKYLTEQQVPISYFKDLSQTVKQLFN